MYGCGMAIAIIATLLIPVCARASPYLVIAMRVIIGMGTVSMHSNKWPFIKFDI